MQQNLRTHPEAAVEVDQTVLYHPYMSEEPRNAMEGRARRRASPAGMRTKVVRVQAKPPPPSRATTKRCEPETRVAVVYYLCHNRHLEHPHFMEVPLASLQAGLHLQDVMSRLDALRGKGMAAMYSWSCKRRYKNGFVWHDLSEDDLLLPAQGTEYVLKGSELPNDQSPPLLPDHHQITSRSNAKVQQPNPTQQQESPHSPRSNHGWTSTSPSPPPPTDPAVPVIKEAVPPPPPQLALSSSPSASTIGDNGQCRMPHSGSSGSSSPKTSMSSSGTSSPSLNNPVAAHDESTQTDEKARGDNVKLQQGQDAARVSPKGPEIVDESHSKHPAAGEYPCRSGTLQSLIRAEAAGRRGVLEDKTTTSSISGKLKPANLLMRLMACGPNHPGFGFVQTSYKPRFTQLEFPLSPELSPLGALKPGTTSAVTVRASETENSSGSVHDSVIGKLKRSSSSHNHQDGVCEEVCSKGDSVNLSRSTSKRISDQSSGKIRSSGVVSFHDEKEKVIKIEERLASGARVVIH